MEMLGMLALVVIAFFLVKVIKDSGGKPKQSVRQYVQTVPRNEQTIPAVQSRPIDEFAASPHYQQVKELLNTYDPYGKQPKYKIELLMQSLGSGIDIHDIDTQFYIGQSIEKSLPYFCETEYEFNKFFNGSQPVLFGSIHGILDLINTYTIGYTLCGYNRAHSGKKEYWTQRLCELADNGNFEAQAALCSNCVHHYFSERERSSFKERFETTLWALAESGDGEAQLAVGEFLARGPLQKIEWLTKAAQKGLSDAWYQLGLAYESKINMDENGQFRPNCLSENEVRQLMEKKIECLLKGAELDNGVMAAWCQYKIGSYYADGDLLPRDYIQAAYWYQKALENGEESAKDSLEYVGTKLAEQES